MATAPILTDMFGPMAFKTGPGRSHGKSGSKKAKKRGDGKWEISLLRMIKTSDMGTVTIAFVAGENGLLPSITADAFHAKAHPWPDGRVKFILKVGGPERSWIMKSPLKAGEKATYILRWRQRPLTREVILKTNDGTEFTWAADVRTPWEEMAPRGNIKIQGAKNVKVLSGDLIDDAVVASETACYLEVPPIDQAEWIKAQSIQ